jgi:uncharacterized membrane protein (DUF106 family)
MFKTADQIEVEKQKHRAWVVFWFAVLLSLIIIGLCIYIYKQDKIFQENAKENLHKYQKAIMENQHSQNGFTAKELMQATNMRPFYMVDDESNVFENKNK